MKKDVSKDRKLKRLFAEIDETFVRALKEDLESLEKEPKRFRDGEGVEEVVDDSTIEP